MDGADRRARACIFDIGGVLTFAPRITDFEVFSRWEQAVGLGHGEITRRAQAAWEAGRKGDISEAQFHSQLGESLGWSAEQVEAFMGDFWAEYKGRPNTELIVYLAGLRQRCRTALLSNSFVGARERQQELNGITDLTVYSHEVGISKPDHRIFNMTCDWLRVPAEDAVFVDDIEVYVETARELGMHGVLFRNNEQAVAEIDIWLGSSRKDAASPRSPERVIERAAEFDEEPGPKPSSGL